MTSRSVVFDPFELQLDSATLKKGGRIVKLAPQPAKLLVLLVERGGDVVTREEIQASLWPEGTFVDFDQSINFCVKRIREALGDDPSAPRFVETVPKRGYRFLGQIGAPSLDAEKQRSSRGIRWLLAGAVALAAAVVLVITRNPEAPTPGSPVHLSITLEPGQILWARRPAVVSPDGTQIVFTSSGRLFLRSVGTPDARPIAGTENAQNPFFSPDGSRIGFMKHGYLQTLSLPGGKPSSIVAVDNYVHGHWGDDGSILYSVAGRGPIFRIPETGGSPEACTVVDREAGETGHGWPFLLPDGRALLFTVYRESAPSLIAVRDLETGDRRVLVEDARNPVYARTGDLVFGRGSSLLSVPFDRDALATVGAPRSLLTGVAATRGTTDYDLSRSGTLVYVPEDNARFPVAEIVWVDREGRAELVTEQRLPFLAPRLSRDGKKLSITVAVEELLYDLYVLDLESGSLVRHRLDGDAAGGLWAPDDQRFVFSSKRTGPQSLFISRADGSGQAKQLTRAATWDIPNSWSASGWLAFVRAGTDTRRDIYVMFPTGEGEPPRRILGSEYAEVSPALSPDGNWLTYVSDETGAREVYVTSVQDTSVKRKISVSGGVAPLWSRDGSEIFYFEEDNMMAVDVATSPRFERSSPRKLFQGHYELGGDVWMWTNYDVTPNGERFVLIRAAEETGSRKIHVVLNWHEELERMDRDGR